MSLCCSCVYIGSGCNRSPNTLNWGRNGMICYGSCNAIQLWKYEAKQDFHHFQTLLAHKNLVTSVHWIRNSDQEKELISTSADHTAVIWTLQENLFVKSSVLLGHTDVVQNANGMYFTQNSREVLFIATLSTDSTLRVWKRFEDKTDCIQTISFGNGFGLDVKFSSLNDTNELIMLVGADDSKIHIYSQDEDGDDCFYKVLSLEGHENWIRSLDVIDRDDNTKLIASASQDCYIRIWKIVAKEPMKKLTTNDYLKLDEASFSIRNGHTYLVFLESVLSGHENWIYSAQWCFLKSSSNGTSPLQLLSTSMDKTMIIWEADYNSNIWTEKIRVGEVGGNTLGFFGGVFSPCGKVIVAHSHQGAIHMWKLNEELGDWVPGITFGGHFEPVLDIDWDPEGKYLISCSSDKTTRIHAQYVTSYGKSNWYEIARPQVHGYNMGCLAIINRFKFISSGGEKVIRAFTAPKNFTEALKNIARVDVSTDILNELAEGASVPSLGLSNKAVFEENLNEADSLARNDLEMKHPKDCYPDFYYTPIRLTAPPTEEILIQNTLWPEVQKLYGHVHEVYSLTSNHSGTLIATACKANKPEMAAIILWDTTSWLQVGQLIFHSLTVTQLEFSPDDEFLLSVSRDRTWAVYRHFPNESPPYRKIANLAPRNSVHTRIIWSCSWTFDSLYFATASRDKKVAVWGRTSVGTEVGFPLCTQLLEVEDSATALSFAPSLISDKYILAVGLENGCIVICTWCKDSSFIIHQKLSEDIAHHLTVNRLKFSPVITTGDNKQNTSSLVQLASCSNDHHVKIYHIIMSL